MIAFRLPNARVGNSYSHRIEIQPPLPEPVIYLDIAVPPALGLEVDLATGTITGTPPLAGEFTIAITYALGGESPSREQTSQVRLLVNQDPKLMWKNLPSNQDDPFWKPDEAIGALSTADFRIVAASQRGRSHAHVGSFRDDDFSIDSADEGRWAIAVVSDGAGSARYSRRGSQIICNEAARYLKRALDEPAADAIGNAAQVLQQARDNAPDDQGAIDKAQQQLHASAVTTVGHAVQHAVTALHAEVGSHSSMDATYRDFSSTAIIAACRRFPFGTLCIAYWVGDGAIGVYARDRGVTLLGDVDSGEFSGQTRFLDNDQVTPEALARRTRVALVPDMTALILMTDGVTDARFDSESQLAQAPVWDSLWQELNLASAIEDGAPDTPQRLLSWLDFWSQGNHDDRTIALVIQEK